MPKDIIAYVLAIVILSLSPTAGAAELPAELQGDLNDDGVCDIVDLNMVMIDWGKSVPDLADPRSDADGSGTVNVIDLNMVMIDWGKLADFLLTVNGGTGEGIYHVNDEVSISANPDPAGAIFDHWDVSTPGLFDPNETDVLFVMPPIHVTVTAIYSYFDYALTVVSGGGGGSYTAGQIVPISADPALEGMYFVEWMGDISGIADLNEADTTVTMSDSDAEITATYRMMRVPGDLNEDGTCDVTDLNMVLIDWGKSGENITDARADATGDGMIDITDLNVVLINWGEQTVFRLTVSNGTGDGLYPAGADVPISATPGPFGSEFERWVGDIAGVADANQSTTTIAMPAGEVYVTAAYTDPLYSHIKYPYVPYAGAGVSGTDPYYFSMESVASTQRIQELDAIFARTGSKTFDWFWADGAWQEERAIFHDVSTGATVYLLTNDSYRDETYYHKGNWSANGAHIVWSRNVPPPGTSRRTKALTVMNSDGTRLRPIGLEFDTVQSYQCSKIDPNIVYAEADGIHLRAIDINTGETTEVMDDMGLIWHIKMSMDGRYLLVATKDSVSVSVMSTDLHVISTDGLEYYVLPTDASTGIHDSYMIHPTEPYVMYWREGHYYPWQGSGEGIRLRRFDDTETIITNIAFDYGNHGRLGLAPLPGTIEPYLSAFHEGAWMDCGSDGLNWSYEVNTFDPQNSSPTWKWWSPVEPMGNYKNGYATWKPVDEPWIFASDLVTAPYVSEMKMAYVFPVASDTAPRFRICQIGNSNNTILDNCEASPDGTKVLFTSDFLGRYEILYVVARLPEKPVNVTAVDVGGNVQLSWQFSKHHKETAGYNVYRSDFSGHRYEQVNDAPVESTSFIDNSADANGTYYYVVTAVETSGLEGCYSAEAAYGPYAASDHRTIFAEAESGSWNNGFWKGFYGTCSDLYYIWMRLTQSQNATATIAVELPRSDDYYIWARIKAGSCTMEGELLTTAQTQWEWVRSASPVALPAGVADIDVNSTVYGTGIDAIYLTTDESFIPTGKNSMDQIAPPVVTGLSAPAIGLSIITISWDASPADDLHHYNLYCSTSSDFTCSSETLIASPADNEHRDWNRDVYTTYYYKVTAVDRQGNESPPSQPAQR